jgi:dihydrodipicolinate synthase/N-acetylneuraminate lyase
METWNLSQRLQKLSRAYRWRPAALLKGALMAQGIFSSATLAPGTEPASPEQQEALLALLDSLNQ